MKLVLYFFLSSLACWVIWRYSRPFAQATKKLIAAILLFTGLAMAMAIGTATHLVLPGIGSIGVSAASGALVGCLTWLAVGTLGVVPIGLAIGLGSMVSAATGLSVLGGITGGIGLKTVLVPYVPAVIWIPLLVTAFVIRKGGSNYQRKSLAQQQGHIAE